MKEKNFLSLYINSRNYKDFFLILKYPDEMFSTRKDQDINNQISFSKYISNLFPFNVIIDK